MNKTDSQHLLDIESLSQSQLNAYLDLSLEIAQSSSSFANRCAGKVLLNMFLEPSTRTRMSFEFAAKRLGMHVVNFQPDSSSSVKGESLIDTFHTLQAMQPDVIAIRHREDGMVASLAAQAEPGIHIINAGDGCSEHPTQALLDAVTLLRKSCNPRGKTVAIVGDVKHSRVAGSAIALFRKMAAATIRLAGPPELLLQEGHLAGDVEICNSLDEAIRGVDIIIMLRIQRERFGQLASPDELLYFDSWGLTAKHLELANQDCFVLHPGPVNRGVEITSDVADGPQSLIADQVRNGVYTRMAVLMNLVTQTQALK